MIADIIQGISTADLELGLFVITVFLFAITAWLTRLTKQNVDATNKLVDLTKQNVDAAADSVISTNNVVSATNNVVSATNNVVSATTKLIELQAEPYVYIDASWESVFLSDRQHLSVRIMIKNRGGSPARDIKITDVRDDFLVGVDAATFKELTNVKNGIKELAPDQDFPLARLIEDGSWELCPLSEIFFEYKTVSGKSKFGSSIIDFRALAAVY